MARLYLTFMLMMVFSLSTTAEAAIYFKSDEENYSADSTLPTSSYLPVSDFLPRQDQGYTRVGVGNPKGSKVIEWKSDVNNTHDMGNELKYQTIPPNGGTLYMAFFFKAIRVNGVSVWPAPGGGREGFDKAIELYGPNYRWTLNFGIRAQNGPANTWSIFVSNPSPGHFNPECEVYDSYWQNLGGFGRGLSESTACQPNMVNPYFPMSYDQWYAVVFKVVFSGSKTGEIGMWINGTKVMQFTNIQTCGVGASSCVHQRPQMWGTYDQPSYTGPIHKRQLDAFVITDDLTYLQANGYFSPPSGGGSPTATQPPPAPTNLVVQ